MNNKTIQIFLLLNIFLFLILNGCKAEKTSFDSDWDPIISQKVDSVLNLMTLDEKLGQLTLLSSGFSETGPTLREDFEQLVREGKSGAIFNAYTVEYTNWLQRIAVEETRLGIPLLFAFDVIHGYKTIFPIPLGETATWDPELVEKVSRAAAIESAAAGLHWTFAPMIDVSPDPRWGRIAESAGEDPLLNSVFGKARVRGYQGNDLYDLNTIMATAKHFAAYGAAEGGRDYNTVDISERVLREVYLPPFKDVLDEGVATFMTAFNEYDGVPATGSKFLMNTILRDEWNFNGFVVTDYTSIPEMIQHGVAANDKQAAELAINANVDMEMQSTTFLNEIPALIEEGSINEKQIDRAVARILRMKFELGLFDDPYRYSDAEREKETLMKQEFLDLALEISKKSIVLLKNENQVLPISTELNQIAVLGPLADNQQELLGSWSGAGRAEDNVTLFEGIKNYVSEGTRVVHALGVDFTDLSRAGFQEAVNLARNSDVAVVAVGEEALMSGEAASRATLNLPGAQEEFLKAIYETGTPVVMVLMAGRPLTINWADENIPAILNTWFLGTQTGNAIAEVLFGNHNPSGKLPVTFPAETGQAPYYYYHKNTGRPMDPNQKYTSKYIDAPNAPLYPFGYGLSFTNFEYSNLQLDKKSISKSDTLEISVDVTNTGSLEGDEVVQFYTRTLTASVTRPVKQLRDFKKITLSPGQTETVKFQLHPSQLMFYDIEMNYVVEPGTINVYTGTNSESLLKNDFIIQ
ncbi:MAG: glycoside hydrolase family 3 N-terminal domain-containing protein [Balneolaceae bacterium]